MTKNKLYILTIEFNDETDEIEYVQEEVVDPDDLKGENIIGVVEDYKFWDQESIDYIRQYYDGEIGES